MGMPDPCVSFLLDHHHRLPVDENARIGVVAMIEAKNGAARGDHPSGQPWSADPERAGFEHADQFEHPARVSIP